MYGQIGMFLAEIGVVVSVLLSICVMALWAYMELANDGEEMYKLNAERRSRGEDEVGFFSFVWAAFLIAVCGTCFSAFVISIAWIVVLPLAALFFTVEYKKFKRDKGE